MTLSAAVILAGYGVLVWQFGAWGLLAVVAHVLVLLACIPRQ